jgi:hypothetical protein
MFVSLCIVIVTNVAHVLSEGTLCLPLTSIALKSFHCTYGEI